MVLCHFFTVYVMIDFIPVSLNVIIHGALIQGLHSHRKKFTKSFTSMMSLRKQIIVFLKLTQICVTLSFQQYEQGGGHNELHEAHGGHMTLKRSSTRIWAFLARTAHTVGAR